MIQHKNELLAILDEALGLVSLPGNDFLYSHWVDTHGAATELREYIAEIKQGDYTHLPELKIIFAPTGSLQEVSLRSNWGEAFLNLAKRFDSLLHSLDE